MSFAKARLSHLVRTEVPYLKNYQAYIGGKWLSSADNTKFPVYNPANGENIADVANCGKADTERAVEEASKAFVTWRKKTAKVVVQYIFVSELCTPAFYKLSFFAHKMLKSMYFLILKP